jgi:superfamily II DNA or RNA helicase
MAITLRHWQEKAIKKSLDWFKEKKDKKFLINAAPGSGKTICACVIANELFKKNEIERVIVIAPMKSVVTKWAEDFFTVTGRDMMKFTGEIEDDSFNICATWHAVQSLLDAFQHICKKYKTLIICDEHHHAAIEAVWGEGAGEAFFNSKYVIVLTGTPIRTDGKEPVWFSYSPTSGKLVHPQEGTYTLDYGEAVDYGYCRPITFHRHEGKFDVLLGNETLAVSGKDGVDVDEKKHPKKLVKSIQNSLNFYTLARKPVYINDDEKTPDVNSYQSTMLQWGIDKLEDVKLRTPEAGGLVIAPSIKVANYMARLLEILTKEKPMIVHTETANTEDKIKMFRKSKKNWLVSVAMISEGVDIPRLRVLVYLPNPQTELSFRQAVGRVVRTLGEEDESRAYCVMPLHEKFVAYARRVMSEMSPKFLGEEKIKNKICPSCRTELKKDQSVCSECSYEFPAKKTTYKHCLDDKCQALNPVSASTCQTCGESFHMKYKINLASAFRDGVIANELDISEEDVQIAEKNFEQLRKDFLEEGDPQMIKLMKKVPQEAWAKIARYTNKWFKDK